MSTPLTRKRVVEAALWVVDHEGLAQLTMRRVGRHLECEAMALYRYVDSRDDLLGGVVELILDELEDPPKGPDWQATLTTGARNFRSMILRHVNIAPLIAAQALTTPTNLRPIRRRPPTDVVLSSLQRAGFDPLAADFIYRLVTSYTLGHIIATQLRPCSKAQTLDQASAPTDMSNVVELHPAKSPDQGSSEFDLGLAILLDGIASQMPPPTSNSSDVSRR